jgi:TetR/AcrR family transcriptional regulator, transcriptional repressor for nem operon
MNQDTRQKILQQHFEAMHRQGFQGMRTDKVIAGMGITKGAFYHYFPDKPTLGYAVVEEMLAPGYVSLFVFGESDGHPVDFICERLLSLVERSTEAEVCLGCPLNNLMQEMSGLDEGFRVRLNRILQTMQQQLEAILQKGLQAGQIRPGTDAKQMACFILSAMEGSYGIAKSLQSRAVFEQSIRQLVQFLQLLKTSNFS